MYLLIHHSETEFPIRLPAGLFHLHNIYSPDKKSTENDYLFRSNPEEFLLNSITEQLDQSAYQSIKAVVIVKELGGNGWVRAVNLAGHFACTQFKSCALNKVPIILSDWNDLDINDPTLKQTSLDNFLQTEGIYFKKFEELFSNKPDPITGFSKYSIESLIVSLKAASLEHLGIRASVDTSHQATNEWGAMKLASNFGLNNEIQFSYPKHLHFKYLLNFIDNKNNTPDRSLNNLFTKVLLIDDNADVGWSELISKILQTTIDTQTSIDQVLAWTNVSPQNLAKYELIFLDLYLRKGSVDTSASLNLLKSLKTYHPQIPVVIFTASDKAWNLDRILELGADGMCIKESPVYFRNQTYSQRNFSDFKTTILHVHSKYQVLGPYWIAIEKITKSQGFQQLENAPRRIKDRINERFRMFYGLLKKGFDQWDYDKNTFYYSDYELAFMTLWSVLNEIQEARYDKNDRTPITTLVNGHGTPVLAERDGSPILPPKGYNWSIKGQLEKYVSHDFIFDSFDGHGNPATLGSGKYKLKSAKLKCGLMYNPKVPPYYQNGSTEDRNTAHRELSGQIAFLLLNDSRLRASAARNQYLIDLNELNMVRNSLYLTHGETNQAYYTETEKEKRQQPSYNIRPDKDILRLFKLISFLMTGNELS